MIENVIDGNERNESSIGNISQTMQASCVVAAIKHAGRKPNRPRRGLLQPNQKRAKPLGVDTRRRHDNKIKAFNMIQKIRQSENAVAFFSSAFPE